MGREAGGRPASFGEFGVAMAADVFTPDFPRLQPAGAPRALPQRTDWLPDLAADISRGGPAPRP